MAAGYLYILKSLRNKRYYVGSTDDLVNRLKEHNSGKSPYTRLTRPFELMFSKEYPTLGQARKFEYKLKGFKSKKILDKIVSSQELLLK